MKKIVAFSLLALLGGAALLWNALHTPAEFGAFEGAPTVEVAKLIARPAEYTKTTVAIDGVITQQCETMGCFFFFRSGGERLRVDLAEIAMHAPMGKNGHHARVEGRMVPYNEAYQFWASAVAFE